MGGCEACGFGAPSLSLVGPSRWHSETMRGRPYNVVSVGNLCGIRETIRADPEFDFLAGEIGHDPDKRNYVVSNERIEATGFKPSMAYQGIEELRKAFGILRRN